MVPKGVPLCILLLLPIVAVLQQSADDHTYVHIVPHTHDDVGWLKTIDEYFSNMYSDEIQYAGVEIIIDSVINELLLDPARKFSLVEMKFLSMWWDEQTQEMKDAVRSLIAEGRLEIIGAGWSMHDEACPHFEDMMNNMIAGHAFAKDELGAIPRIGWQIDPFGHSSASMRLMSEMGFDGVFFARLDYQDKERRMQAKEMEFVWRPAFEQLGKQGQLMAHAFYGDYYSPNLFNFELVEEKDPFVDDPELDTFNADNLTMEFNLEVLARKDIYRTNHILVVLGGDFNFMNGKMYFQSIDKLISYFNSKYDNATLFYSTPSDYLDAIQSQDIEWPTKYDDMLPYADYPEAMWTGFYSSRPNAKEYIRKASHNFGASSYLYALKMIDQDRDRQERDIKRTYWNFLDALGVNQHHDAVTGTSRQHVANDYVDRLWKAMHHNNFLYSEVIEEEALAFGLVNDEGMWHWCERENSTYLDCPIAKYPWSTFLVAIHNPSLASMPYAKFSTSHPYYKVHEFDFATSSFEEVTAQAFCSEVWQNKSEVYNCDVYAELKGVDDQMVFLKVFYDLGSDLSLHIERHDLQSKEHFEIQNDYEILKFIKSDEDGQEFHLTKKETNSSFKFSFDIRYWPSYFSHKGQNSGVYIFRPADQIYDSLPYAPLKSLTYQEGPFASQIQMRYYNDETDATVEVFVRLFKGQRVSEWTVNLGGVPKLQIHSGMEVTVNFRCFDISNEGSFYTDSNGLYMLQRTLNSRPTWDWSGPMNISGNYYPVQTAIFVRDEQKQMTVMNSRSQGGASLKEGAIELMQNRRIFEDDDRGMGEKLNEMDGAKQPVEVPATYYLQLFNLDEEPSMQRMQQLKQDQPPQSFFQFEEDPTQFRPHQIAKHKHEFSSKLKSYLTNNGETSGNILKLSLIPVEQDLIWVRLVNLGDPVDSGIEESDDEHVMRVNIYQMALDLFVEANGDMHENPEIKIQELSLSGNQFLSDMLEKKVQWKTEDDWLGFDPEYGKDKGEWINLEKQRIRLFEIEYIYLDQKK